jgi:hypothetical protein
MALFCVAPASRIDDQGGKASVCFLREIAVLKILVMGMISWT